MASLALTLKDQLKTERLYLVAEFQRDGKQRAGTGNAEQWR